MRVLVVVHGFPPHAQGGAEIYAEDHARALVRLFGDHVHVLTREQNPEGAEYAVRTEERDGLTVTWINNTFRDIRTYEDSYRNLPIARIAAGVIDEFQPHVAHVHHLTCLSTEIPRLLAARGVPVMLTLHDYWLLCHRGQLLDTEFRLCAGPEPSGCRFCLGAAAAPVPSTFVPALRAIDRSLPRAITAKAHSVAARLSGAMSGGQEDPVARQRLEHMRSVCGHVTRFLAPSRSVRDRFITFGIAQKRIELSPYGIDRTRFTPRLAPPVRTPLSVGFLGTLMVSKAPHILLEAFKRLPSGMATVDLMGAPADYHGDASYRRVLEPLLSLPGVRVLGPQAHGRVPDALAALDVLVMPSIWPETSGIVIREAFLTGLPVVASNIGGIPEQLEHERNGLLFEPGDVEGLTQALRRLVEEPGLLDRLRTGAAGTAIRSLDDDVAAARRLYESHVAARSAARLAAVVLNFRTAADTAIAIGSLLASDRPPDDVIVVDNDSDSECRNALARWGEAITYVRTGGNLGFSGGMNIGIRLALDRGADFVLLVNSDVVVPPDCLGQLEAALAAKPDTGIAGPLVLSRSLPGVVGSSGVDYDRRTGRMRHRGAGATVDSTKNIADADVDAVSGCLMLVARKVFDRVGLLDERYFFSFEEIDFCLRARAAGIGTRLVGRAVAYHEGGQAIGAQSPRRLYFAARNHLLLAQTHAAGDRSVKRAARALFIIALNLAHSVRTSGGSLPARLGATLRGLRDHLDGRYGNDRAA
jgi:GT2 family glycosyltransferase/glycosyltransferase involved in cell wall biosynthesis